MNGGRETMQKHVNLTAYDDVENSENFTEEHFIRYCEKKLSECEAEVSFIKANCIDETWNGKICEIGSGNSKLLYRLERDGVLEQGTGIEISNSRHTFAEKFKKFAECNKVINVCGNFLDLPPIPNTDLILAVDIVFQLVATLYDKAENEALNWIFSSLRTGGYLILELRDFINYLKMIELSGNNEIRLWDEFPEYNPFQYGLDYIRPDLLGNLVWQKTFLNAILMNSRRLLTFSNPMYLKIFQRF